MPYAPNTEDPGESRGRLADWLLYIPAEVSRTKWIARIATLAFLSFWTLWIWRDTHIRTGEIGSNFLHLVLLPSTRRATTRSSGGSGNSS